MASPNSPAPVWDYAGWWLARNQEHYEEIRSKYYPTGEVYDCRTMWPYEQAGGDALKMAKNAALDAIRNAPSFAYTSYLWWGLWCMFWGWLPWQMLIGKDRTDYETIEMAPRPSHSTGHLCAE